MMSDDWKLLGICVRRSSKCYKNTNHMFSGTQKDILLNNSLKTQIAAQEPKKTITELFKDYSGNVFKQKLPQHLDVNGPIPLMVFSILLTKQILTKSHGKDYLLINFPLLPSQKIPPPISAYQLQYYLKLIRDNVPQFIQEINNAIESLRQYGLRYMYIRIKLRQFYRKESQYVINHLCHFFSFLQCLKTTQSAMEKLIRRIDQYFGTTEANEQRNAVKQAAQNLRDQIKLHYPPFELLFVSIVSIQNSPYVYRLKIRWKKMVQRKLNNFNKETQNIQNEIRKVKKTLQQVNSLMFSQVTQLQLKMKQRLRNTNQKMIQQQKKQVQYKQRMKQFEGYFKQVDFKQENQDLHKLLMTYQQEVTKVLCSCVNRKIILQEMEGVEMQFRLLLDPACLTKQVKFIGQEGQFGGAEAEVIEQQQEMEVGYQQGQSPEWREGEIQLTRRSIREQVSGIEQPSTSLKQHYEIKVVQEREPEQHKREPQIKKRKLFYQQIREQPKKKRRSAPEYAIVQQQQDETSFLEQFQEQERKWKQRQESEQLPKPIKMHFKSKKHQRQAKLQFIDPYHPNEHLFLILPTTNPFSSELFSRKEFLLSSKSSDTYTSSEKTMVNNRRNSHQIK